MSVPVIAIDGPAGSGKSSTARALAERLGFIHLDSGALYRTVALAALREGSEGDQSVESILDAADRLEIRLTLSEDGFIPMVAGEDVSNTIRSGEVTMASSRLAGIPEIRQWVNEKLRAAVAESSRGVVVDGRDIGTIVFPNATVKIFLTASPGVRAGRRLRERGIQEPGESELVEETRRLEARDMADRTRAVAPLKKPRDAVEVDTSNLSFEEQVEKLVLIVTEGMAQVDR